MSEIKKEFFWERRPQNLCKMCGKCCRVVTTSKSYEELKRLASKNDEGAKDFLELFEPYESIEKAKEVDIATVENIGYDKNTTFYHCRFIGDDNLCTRYETRKTLCRICPSNPFVVVPPNCGFEEWLKSEREKIVKKVRRLKQERLEYINALKTVESASTRETLSKLITIIDEFISNYAKYGAEEW